jgi:hypothetical protein
MDSFPQEIIDEIIDNLPRCSLCSSALIAKRWRKRSQQRALDRIPLETEPEVNNWYTATHNDPEGITTYVKFARFDRISRWSNRALFGRVLQNFSSLTKLWLNWTEVPNGILEYISHEGFAKNITCLYVTSPGGSLSTVISMVIAFPNLQQFRLNDVMDWSTELPQVRPVMQQRRPFDSFGVYDCVDGVAQALATLHLAPRLLALDIQTQNIQYLLVPSSATVADLSLTGVYIFVM